MKRVLAISVMALLSTALTVRTADASVAESISHVTFSGSFQLPGMTLPGGTYTFSRVAPNVILVRSRDHRTVYGMFMTIPTLKPGHLTKPEIVMSEARAGEAPRVERWFPFPRTSYLALHQSTGYELRY